MQDQGRLRWLDPGGRALRLIKQVEAVLRITLGLVSFLAAAPAAAHADAPWSFDPWVLAPLALTLTLYVRSFRHLGRAQRWTFALGLVVLVAALVSPLDALGEARLSAHMAQHALLVAVAPPLLLAGNSAAIFVWGLPASWRGAWGSVARVFSVLSRPLLATLLHGLALWLWHAPAAFNAAAASEPLHFLQHLTFFATALFFWRAVLGARSAQRAAAPLGAAFITLLHSGLLGALITFAPSAIYAYGVLEDQQLAGLIMWVPMGMVYLAACLLLASRFLTDYSLHRG